MKQVEAILGKENYLVLRYEDLVTQSEDVLKNIAEFLEIKFSKSMLVPTIMGVPHGGNNHDGRKNFQIKRKQFMDSRRSEIVLRKRM